MGNYLKEKQLEVNQRNTFLSSYPYIEIVQPFSLPDREKHFNFIKPETEFLYVNEYILSKVNIKISAIKMSNQNDHFLTPKSFPSNKIFPILFALSNDKLLPVVWLKKIKQQKVQLFSGIPEENFFEDKEFLTLLKSALYVAKNYVFSERSEFKNITTLPFVLKTKNVEFTKISYKNHASQLLNKKNVYIKNDYSEVFLYRGKLYYKFPPYLGISEFEAVTKERLEFSSGNNVIFGFEKGEKIPSLFIIPSGKKPVYEILYTGEKPIELRFSIPLRKISPYFYEQTGLSYFLNKKLKLIYVSTLNKDVSLVIVSSDVPTFVECNPEEKNIRVSVNAKFPPKTSFKIVFLNEKRKRSFASFFKSNKKPVNINFQKNELLLASTVLEVFDKREIKKNYSERFFRLYTPEAEEKFSSPGFDVLEREVVKQIVNSFVWGNEEKNIKKTAKKLEHVNIGNKLYPSGTSLLIWGDEINLGKFIEKELSDKEKLITIENMGEYIEKRYKSYLKLNLSGREYFYDMINSLKKVYIEILGIRKKGNRIIFTPIIPYFIKSLQLKKIHVDGALFNFSFKNKKGEFVFKIKNNSGRKIIFLPLISANYRKLYEITGYDSTIKIPKRKMFFMYSQKENVDTRIENWEYSEEKRRLKVKLKKELENSFQFEMTLFELGIKKIVGARTSEVTKGKRLIFIDPKRSSYFYIYFEDLKSQNLLFKSSKKTNNSY